MLLLGRRVQDNPSEHAAVRAGKRSAGATSVSRASLPLPCYLTLEARLAGRPASARCR